MESCDCIDIWPADEYMVVAQHILDMLTAVSFFSVSVKLIYSILTSRAFPDRWIFMHFGAFATLCGATYVTNLWKYSKHSITAAWVIIVIKACAAVVSWLTVCSLIYVIPYLLSLRNGELLLKNMAADRSREVALLLREEEATRSISKLINEIRGTLDGQIISKSTIAGLSRILELEECALWFPSQTNKSLQLSFTLNHSIPVGSTISVSLPLVAEIFKSTSAVRIPHTCPLVRTTPINWRCIPPEAFAFRLPLLHFSSIGNDDWLGASPGNYAVIVLVRPSGGIRKFDEHELELVGTAVEQVAVALAHASAVKESTRACDDLMKQNASLEVELNDSKTSLNASIIYQSAMLNQIPTPVHAMTILSSLLLETKLTPQQREIAEKVVRCSRTMATLIDSQRELCRLEDGTLELNNTVFNLSTIFKQVLDIVKPAAAVKKLSLSLSLAPDLPNFAVGDQERLVQIILGIVINAVKFTEEGHVLVTASLAQQDSFRGWSPYKFCLLSSREVFYLRVQVEDSGCGIDPQEITKVFNQFSGSKNASNHSINRGLGLAICKRLLNLMGGQIWMESEGLGKGSTATFIVRLRNSRANRLQLQ